MRIEEQLTPLWPLCGKKNSGEDIQNIELEKGCSGVFSACKGIVLFMIVKFTKNVAYKVAFLHCEQNAGARGKPSAFLRLSCSVPLQRAILIT